MATNSNYEDKILDAIEEIATDAVQRAGYDKTIQCQIIECIDPTIGKYKVKYQDSSFIAYSGSSDVTYMKGAEVYVLVPANDMTRDKQILGTTKKLGVNYAGNVTEEEDLYERVGTNCIDSNNQYSFCSYKDETKTIYDRNTSNNDVRLNLKSVETYIKKSSSIICGGNFQTKLPKEQQFRGNFGIVFELAFWDNNTGDTVIRRYKIDVNQMIGDPYQQVNWTRQYGIFNIDTDNFQYIDKIYLFIEKFPKQESGHPDDVFIKDIEFYGAIPTSEAELSSYGLVFITPQGTYFDENSKDSDTRLLRAQVRIKGKNIDNNSQSVKYYWFVENVGVIPSSEDYCSYGGQGWQCKNERNQVGVDRDNRPIYEWVPAGWEYTVSKKDSQAKETRYKCVAVYDDITLSKEITITNYDSQWDITIESDSGTEFYFDGGTPSLTCRVNNQIQSGANFTYLWAEIDSNNIFSSLAETPAENNEYNNAATAYKNLQARIEAETAMPAASQAQLNSYLTIMEKYDKLMRVERMHLWKIQVNTIINFSTYKCSVYNNGVYIGSASIVIRNTLNMEDAYTLVINNGTKTFSYTADGNSPINNMWPDRSMAPTNLTFTVYDNLGRPINKDALAKCPIKWIVPNKNTMLIIPDGYVPSEEDETNGTATYTNLTDFNYNIADIYNVDYTNNNIKLQIEYKNNIILTAFTNFTFVKDGEPGTNGTEYIAKIVPNISGNWNSNVYPMILNGSPNFTPRQSGKWFKVEIWHNGDKIFDNYASGPTTENNKTAVLTWTILGNKHDTHDISVTSDGTFSYKSYSGNSPANIIQCTVSLNGVYYYATMPLITATMSSGYRAGLKENTGFRFATYSADGRYPSYSNSEPFEIIVERTINGYQENVSKMEKSEAITYSWKQYGRIYNGVTGSWTQEQYLIEDSGNKTTDRNEKYFIPVNNYDGECLNIALECTMTRSGSSVGRIHIPIHFMLNRYGQAELNNWNGNSVELDSNGGYLLAPKVGAGIKEKDNSFTGMWMGAVKEANQSQKDVGLLGYHKGQRTLYLSAYNGYGIFGKNGPGQIILDPTNNNAMIYSNNFWANYIDDTTDPTRNGLPRTNYSYNDRTHKYDGQANQTTGDMQDINSGMLIDLTTPRILFGNGNFRVEPNGFTYMRGGGEIAGWKIDDYKIYKDWTGMSSVENVIDAGVTTEDVPLPAPTQHEIKALAFWAGDRNFYVTHDGYLRTTEATIGAGSTNNLIYIGGNGVNSVIHTFDKPTFDADGNGFYIGTDGFALGGLNEQGHSKFEVTNEGILNTRAGTIGGWSINDDNISTENIVMKATGDIECNIDGENKWFIHNDGSVSFTLGNIGGWIIEPNSLHSGNIYLNADGSIQHVDGTWSINQDGSATFTTGDVGGWIIEPNNIHSGNIYLNANGSIQHKDGIWSINQDGTATFTAGNIGNWQITNGSLTNGEVSLNADGSLTAKKGTIGGWNINENNLTSTGQNVILSSNGDLDCNTGAGWHIHNDGTVSFGDKLKWDGTTLTINGNITSQSGQIGGWVIEETELHSVDGNVHLRSGSGNTHRNIEVGDGVFYVQNNGYVYAKSGRIGGWNLSSTTLSSTYFTIDSSNNRIRWKNGNNFFACGGGTAHPRSSGFNIDAENGIGLYSTIDIDGGSTSDYRGGISYESSRSAMVVRSNGGLGACLQSGSGTTGLVMVRDSGDVTINASGSGEGHGVIFNVGDITVNSTKVKDGTFTFKANKQGTAGLDVEQTISITFKKGFCTGFSVSE